MTFTCGSTYEVVAHRCDTEDQRGRLNQFAGFATNPGVLCVNSILNARLCAKAGGKSSLNLATRWQSVSFVLEAFLTDGKPLFFIPAPDLHLPDEGLPKKNSKSARLDQVSG